MPGDSPVLDRRPPPRVLRVINPVMRTMLTSPLGRAMGKSIVLLEFTGRKSARTYRIVALWHDFEDGKVVFSPSPWRVNFRGGAPVSVTHAGQRLQGTGTLVEDPEIVAVALQGALDFGTKPRDLGLRVPAGHQITAQDILANRRAMISLDVAGPAA